MTINQASNLICPFNSTVFTIDKTQPLSDGLEWEQINLNCITTKCMAWQSTKSTIPVEPSHYICGCGYQKSTYKAGSQCTYCDGYTTNSVYPNGSPTEPIEPDECEGYCSRLPH